MRWHRQSVAAMILMTPLIVPTLARAQGAVTATLSVLAAPVERIAGDAGAGEPGVSGMNLAEGDRVRTGAGGVALITFLDGSTVTLLSETEVTVKQAPAGRAKAAGIRMLIHAGRVWARVVQAAGSRSTLTLESNDYSATAHDGLIGAEQAAGTFVVLDAEGRALAHRQERPDRHGAGGRPASAGALRHAGDRRALRRRARARSRSGPRGRWCRWCACRTGAGPRDSSRPTSRSTRCSAR